MLGNVATRQGSLHHEWGRDEKSQQPHTRRTCHHKAEILMGLVMAAFALFLNTNSVVSLTSLGILSYNALINLATLRIKYDVRKISVRHVISALGLLAYAGLIFYYFLASVQSGST